MKEIIAGNIARYRKSLSLSMEQLARKVGLTRQTIYNYESGKTLPDSQVLSSLSRVLGVTLDDLLRDGAGAPEFRFRTHSSFGNYPQFAARVVQMVEDYTALEQTLGIPSYTPESIPCHMLEGSRRRVEDTALQFRRRLGLGEAPISNLFESVERLGMKVLRRPIPMKEFYSLSAYGVDMGVFILINTFATSVERQVFSLAHEIGHLILHRNEYKEVLGGAETKAENKKDPELTADVLAGGPKEREQVADHFASHLLVPQSALERELEATTSLIQLKTHFRVGCDVILKRLDRMGKVDYAKANAILRGENKHLTPDDEVEPRLSPVEFQKNERFQRLIWQALDLEKVTELRAAELLDLSLDELRTRRREAEAEIVIF